MFAHDNEITLNYKPSNKQVLLLAQT